MGTGELKKINWKRGREGWPGAYLYPVISGLAEAEQMKRTLEPSVTVWGWTDSVTDGGSAHRETRGGGGNECGVGGTAHLRVSRVAEETAAPALYYSWRGSCEAGQPELF